MGTIGITIPDSVWSARAEQFYTQVLHGLEDTALGAGDAVLSHVARDADEEMRAITRWADRGLVDVLVLKDLRADDPRPAQLARLGLPLVVIGDVRQEAVLDSVAMVAVDNGRTMRTLLQDLHDRGHRAIAHVGGPPELLHSRWRQEAYEEFMRERDLPVRSLAGDYGYATGASATRALLGLDAEGAAGRAGAADDGSRPTVVVYDNDAMAIGGCAEVVAAGLRVPDDVSIIAWDDSAACQTHEPPLAVIDRDPHRIGVDVARAAAALLEDPARPLRIVQGIPVLEPRGTVVAPREDGAAPRASDVVAPV
ncbi:LacI family DNA-binding transcriptional regulator [Brachybacterium sp. DNPG3]